MSTVSVHWAWLFCLFICFACVLLCFHPKMSKCWKTIGFIVFSLTNVEKAFVLLCFWGLGLRKHWIYSHFIGMLFNKLRFSLTEGTSKGSHLGSKRGLHRNRHKAWTDFAASRPPIAKAFFISFGFFHQNQNLLIVLYIRKIFLWKNKCFFHFFAFFAFSHKDSH